MRAGACSGGLRKEEAGWHCSGWHLWECHVTGGFLEQDGKMLLCPGSLALPSGQQVQAHPGLWGSHMRWFPKLQSFPRCALMAHMSPQAL